MATRKTNQPIPPLPTELIISKEKLKAELQKRVESGQEMLDRQITNGSEIEKLAFDFSGWNDYNAEYLKQAFNNSHNEYRTAYVDSGYTMFGMIDETGDKLQD